MKRSNRRPTTLQVELLEPRSVPAGMIGPGFLGAHERHRSPEPVHAFGEFHRAQELFGGRADIGRNDCGPRCENFAAPSLPVDSGRSVAFAYIPSTAVAPSAKTVDVSLPLVAPPPPVARISPPAISQTSSGSALVAEQGRGSPVIVVTQFVSLRTSQSPSRNNERAAAPTDAVFAADDASDIDVAAGDDTATSLFANRRDDSAPSVNTAPNRIESLWDEAIRQQAEENDETEPMEDLIELELQNALRRRQKSRSAANISPPLPAQMPKLSARSDFFQESSWRSDHDTARDNVVWRPSDDGLIELPAADSASIVRTQNSAGGQAASQLNSAAPLEGELGFFQAVAETLEESAAPAAVAATAEAVREPAP